MRQSPEFITTSWDDGHVLDIRMADLLGFFGLRGTFYISRDYMGSNSLQRNEIARLARYHEIGVHTLTHPDLGRMPIQEIKDEILGCREWLEDIIGKACPMFCYPYGSYNQDVVEILKNLGFHGARTVKTFDIDLPVDPFKMGTTIHVSPFPLRKTGANSFYWRYLFQPVQRNYDSIKRLGLSFISLRSWQSLSRALFLKTTQEGGVFHIFGHSWEVEKYDMWDELRSLLKYIADRHWGSMVSNGEILNNAHNDIT